MSNILRVLSNAVGINYDIGNKEESPPPPTEQKIPTYSYNKDTSQILKMNTHDNTIDTYHVKVRPSGAMAAAGSPQAFARFQSTEKIANATIGMFQALDQIKGMEQGFKKISYAPGKLLVELKDGKKAVISVKYDPVLAARVKVFAQAIGFGAEEEKAQKLPAYKETAPTSKVAEKSSEPNPVDVFANGLKGLSDKAIKEKIANSQFKDILKKAPQGEIFKKFDDNYKKYGDGPLRPYLTRYLSSEEKTLIKGALRNINEPNLKGDRALLEKIREDLEKR